MIFRPVWALPYPLSDFSFYQRVMKSGLSMYLAKHPELDVKKVGAPTKPKTPKRRQVKNKKKNPSKGAAKRPPRATKNADLRQFQLALQNPFSTYAFGCRVVDSYSIPTATYHARAVINCVSGVEGGFTCAVLPSPCLSFLNLYFAGNLGTVQGGLSPFAQNPSAFYLTSPTDISALLSEYRVVSWGFRLVAKDTAFNSKGKVYVAPIPTTNNAPSFNTLNTVTGTAASIGEYTIGMDAFYAYNYVIGLPGVRTFSMQDLLRGEVQCCGVPCDATFYTFKGTADRSTVPWNGTQVLADEGVFNNTTGLVNATAGGRKDVASLRGGRAFIIAASGMPPNSNEFDIELIYHLEGTPNMVSGNRQNSLIPSSTRNTNGASWLVETAVSFASKAGALVKFISDPANQAAATRAISFLRGV